MDIRNVASLGLVLSLALSARFSSAHDDVAGTRYIAPSGVDQEHCDSRRAPCRTITYALTHARQGDAIKVGAGLYDLSGVDIETLLFGKSGPRGGYKVEDEFRHEDPDANPTRVTGVDPLWRNTLLAHSIRVEHRVRGQYNVARPRGVSLCRGLEPR
jgi:hypothetical protein